MTNFEFFLWMVGWLFTLGVSVGKREEGGAIFLSLVTGLLLWPFFLGILLFEKPRP